MGIFTFFKNALIVITAIVGVKNFKTAKKLQDQGQDILATKTGQGGKIPIIYGRRRVGSTLLYMDTDSGNSKELFIIYGLCLGEVESIELDTIEINGVPLSDTKVFRDGYYTGSDKISSGAGSLNTVSQIGTSSGSFRGDGRSGDDPAKIYRMVFNAHHGADDQTVDPMLNASQSSKFTSNHRLRGIAYIAASFQYDEKGMFTSVPELTVVVKGKKLYDPRLDGSISGGSGSHRIADSTTYEWSNNAALTLLDYMHQDYGKGLAASLIDLQSFQTAANTADTVVDVPDYSGSYSSATFSADVEDNFITVNEATWKKIKGGELLSVKDSGGTVIINQDDVVDVQRFKPHTESTNYRIYTGTTPPAKVSKSVTFSATNGDATLTVTCTSHGASANDRVLFTGAVSLGGNITATVLNKGYTIATVVDANTFTVEATDLNLDTVLASSSDTGNGGGSAVGKFMYADESGSILAQTRRLQCDGVLDTNETVLDNARDLLSNMRGFLNYVDGKYSVLVEDTGSSSFSITDDHIIDEGISIRYEDKADKLNKVVVQFYNAQKKYESDTKTVFHNNNTSTYKNDDGGEELETTAEFQYITNPYNAFNMGKAILERSRRQKTISFIGTPRLLDLTAGDVVSITYSPYNLSSAAYRVETVNLLDNGLVGIQAIEYFDFYTWSATPPAETVGEDPDTPTGTEVSPPTNLTFTDATSTRRAFLTWTAATNYPAKEFRVIIKNSSAQEIHNRIVSDDFIDLDFIAVANGYVASISSINSVGAESEAASLTFNVTQKPVKLGDIQANAITANEINVANLAAISADLGSITAGSMNIGSGAFTVSSSGVMTATGATVSGAITASSLNVTGATVTGTLDASVITINGEPLDDAFGVTGTGATRVMSIGFQAQNQLKVTDTGLQYLAISTGGSGIGFEAFSVDGADFTFYSTAAGNSQKETIVNKEGSITLSNLTSAPSGSAQTNSLYLLNGALQFNGSAVTAGDITEVVAGTNLNGGGSTGSVTLNLDSTITGNHTFSNNLTVGGDLTVQGTTTSIDTTNLEVKDKNITLNYSTGDSSGNADGAGITIQDAVNSSTDATILWDATNDEFDFSHGISLPDSQKLQFGASNDLQIFHDGNHSRIKDAGTGNLSLQGNDFRLKNSDASSTYMEAANGGSVSLFHAGSKKIETTSSGATVTGTLAATLSTAAQPNITSLGTLTTLTVDDITINASTISDAGNFTIDSGGDISLDADGGDIRFLDGGTEVGTITLSANNFVMRSRVQDQNIIFKGNDGGSTITALTLDMSDAGAATFNSGATFAGDITQTTGDYLYSGGGNFDIKHTTDDQNIVFSTSSSSSTSEKMRIKANGNVGINCTSIDEKLQVEDGNIKIEGGTNANTRGLIIAHSGQTGNQVKLTQDSQNARAILESTERNLRISAGSGGGTGSGETLDFFVNGSERMTIDTSGRLGVGTSSPGQTIDCAGNITAHAFIGRSNESAPTADAAVYRAADNTLAFSTASTERMRINSSGTLIVGSSTDTTTVGSPDRHMAVTSATNNQEVAYTVNVIEGNNNRRAKFFLDDSDGTYGLDATASTGVPRFVIKSATSEKFTIDQSGLVGIGVANPDDYNSSADNLVVGSSGDTGISIVAGTSNDSTLIFADGTGGTAGYRGRVAYDHASDYMRFDTAATERMRIDSSGRVSIGTQSPSGTFHAAGTSHTFDTPDGSGVQIIRTGNSAHLHLFPAFSSVPTIQGQGAGGLHLSYESSTDGIRIDTSNNVGIGTSNPGMILDVDGSSAANDIARFSGANSGTLIFRNATSNEFIMHTSTSDALIFGTNGNNERMRITSGGLVGIGMTPNSGCLLNVNSHIRAENSAFLAGREDASLPAFAFHDDTDTGMFNVASNILAFSTAATERMRIDSSGNCGIGENSPDKLLHLKSSGATGIVIESTTNAQNLDIDFYNNIGSASGRIRYAEGAGSFSFAPNVSASDALTLAYDGSATFNSTISSGAITTTGHIQQNNGYEIRSKDTGGTVRTIMRVNSSNELEYGWSGNGKVKIMGGGSYTERFSIGTDGNATFSNNVTAFSDERLKDNIQTLDGKKALQMRGVSFTKDGKEGSGVIAQEIEKIAPELVLTADDEQGTKSVAYGNLVGYLIEAIKDQQEQIDELKAKLDGSS